MRAVVVLLSLAALGCALAVLGAGPGTKMDLWDWKQGLALMRQMASPFPFAKGLPVVGEFLSPLLTSAALAGVGGLASLFTGKVRLGVFALFCAAIAGASVMIPLKMREAAMSNPFIHDITTDFDNPPAIIAGAGAERANPPAYAGAEKVVNADLTVAEAQKQAFPDITPRVVNAGLDETAEIVREIIGDMKMATLNETLNDDGWLIEATYTSTWFGFIDDFVVRLTPEGSRTRVDVRSKSRVGLSDLGANAARVRAFFERLEAKTEITPAG